MIMHLAAHGRLTWTKAATLLTGTECAWVDMTGAHCGAPPATLPTGASHLWAWNDSRYLRLRFDHEAVYAGELTQEGEGEPVTVTIRTGLQLWRPGDMQAGPIPTPARTGNWHLLEITGAQPITFIRRHS